MKRHELSSEQWELIEPHLRRPAPTGRPPKDRRVMLNGILWIAQVKVPKDGVQSTVTAEQLAANLDDKGGR